MYKVTHSNIRKTGATLCSAVLLIAFVIAPVSLQGTVQKAQAQFPTVEVGPLVGISKANTVFNSISQNLQSISTMKDTTLDPIAYAIAKMLLKNMTQSILNWINSGFQGNPAFVTDLKQMLLDQADAIAGDFIYNDPALNLLCSPFQLDVKIALATTYQERTYGNFSEAQCTLSDVSENMQSFLAGDSFDPASWFEVTQNPANTPTGAYLAAEQELYARIADAQGNTIKNLDWGQGFLPFKVCSDTDVANGTQKNCTITTPGKVIADQVNQSLNAGQEALITADEINEIIGALFAQLAQQAITGVNGLLGLGGNSGFNDNRFGPNNDQSYLEALKDENMPGGVENPLIEAVAREEKHIELQNQVISEINNIEAYLNNAKNQYGSCINLSMPQKLIDERDKAISAVIQSTSVLPILTEMRDKFAQTTDPQEQADIIDTYNQMQADGSVVDLSANNLLQVFIDFELKDDIKQFKRKIDSQKRSCEDDEES